MKYFFGHVLTIINSTTVNPYFNSNHSRWSFIEQESPPAWTQEAYRPPCREYSFCCPILADPPPRVDLIPPAGPDPPSWTWPPPSWTWLPLAGPDPPCWTWPPPPAGPDPSPGWTWPPPNWTWPPRGWTEDWPPPPPRGQTDLWKDRHVSKHYLPPSFGCGR